MLTVTLTKGLPGSGKTTWAHELMKKHPNVYINVCRDDIRRMTGFSSTTDSEKIVEKIRDSIVLLGIEHGKHIIVSDTNLSERHFLHFKQICHGKAAVKIQDFTHVPIETCIKNDLKRLHSVGEKVIREMYKQRLQPKPEVVEFNPNLPSAVIVDLDGTLCIFGNNRSPYDASTCENDTLNVPVANMIRGKTILFTSGREDKYREQTLKFLEKHEIVFKELFMRKSGDMRKDAIIKKEIYDEHIRGRYNIEFCLDDRDQVVHLWRNVLGLPTFQVADGDF